MITRYRFIEFKPWGDKWVCLNIKATGALGTVEFYQPWQKWVFSAHSTAVFSADCLRDIASFLTQLQPVKKV